MENLARGDMDETGGDKLSSNKWPSLSFELLEKSLNGEKKLPIHAQRKAALAALMQTGFPTPQLEEWRYTNVSEVVRQPLSLSQRVTELRPEQVRPYLVPGLNGSVMVFVDGVFSAALSTIQKEGIQQESGVSIRQLASTIDGSNVGQAEKQLATQANFREHAFVALNTAFLKDGVVISIEKNRSVEQPIQLLFISTATQERMLTTPRVLVTAAEGSKACIVESYAGLGANSYLTSAVSEIFIAENASLEHYKIGREGEAGSHIGSLFVKQAANSNFRSHTFTFGGRLTRNEITMVLDGEGIDSSLIGLSVIRGDQHVDNHTVIDHAKPHCLSTERFKGIYGDRSKGVFNGTIIVRQDAQKTNAIQSNQSLLLSNEATIDTKPQLKIWANDVKCTHGATVGQLDDEALFYLRSRGVPKDEARRMLIQAFAGDIVNEVRREELREYLEQLLLQRL